MMRDDEMRTNEYDYIVMMIRDEVRFPTREREAERDNER
jgi:hypothetical protein